MRSLISVFVFLFTFSQLFAQNGIIKGRIFDETNNEPLPFANIAIDGTEMGTTSNENGQWQIDKIPPGTYNVLAVYLGYETEKIQEVVVTNTTPAILNIALRPTSTKLEEVVIRTSSFKRTAESPVSLKTLGIAEIERSPGSNRDISKVLQSLPGVAQSVAFRNDLIIRGGGPGENRFFIEDVETPNINHFATQGASGGPIGLIDANYIRGVDFYTGAFPAYTYNALSSVLRMNFKEPRDDRMGGRFTVGASDLGAAIEGPIGSKGGYFASYRRSYLQFLFRALGLPFLPIYNDVLYKVRYKLTDRLEFYTIFLGSFDNFELNLNANETEEQRYILGVLPVNKQWTYTNGYVFKYYNKRGFSNLVLSRNMLNNTAIKYIDNLEVPENLNLDYKSQEIENKLRLETTQRWNSWRLNAGINYEFARYNNRTFNKIAGNFGALVIDYNSDLDLHKYGFWGQISRGFFDERLTASFGFRADGNNYSAEMSNPFRQFAPRLSLSYSLTPDWRVNFSAGHYTQLPAYPMLGYRDGAGNLVNRDNGLRYIWCSHLVAGVEYATAIESRVSVEGFFKRYNHYPFNLRDSVSIANFGGDFGVVGNLEVDSRSNGRAYGFEALYQQRLFRGIYGIVAYTFVRSEFSGLNQTLLPSSWDARHIISLTAGKRFKRNWEAGAKWRFGSGNPFTPPNFEASSLRQNWDIFPAGIPDYSRLNGDRLSPFHQLDVRVDKKYFFKKISLNLYLDIQNLYYRKNPLPPYLDVVRDAQGNPVVDPSDPNRYLLRQIPNNTGTIVPTFGVILEF